MKTTKRMPVCIIAEAGVNHDGSLAKALKLVDLAAKAGADVVKFQTFRATEEISKIAGKADYQKETTGASESQLEMVRKLELSEAAHQKLLVRCCTKGLGFLSSPFDLGSLELLVRLGAKRLKIPSGEITYAPMMVAAGKSGLPLLLSTGMATLGDVEMALGMVAFGALNVQENLRSGKCRPRKGSPGPEAFQRALWSADGQTVVQERVTLMQCTSEYPAPFSDVNLRGMETLRTAFGLPVGLSDHTVGIAIAIAAVAMGATVIEKHFTYDRLASGPDHRASLEPEEFGSMVRSIREVEQAMGTGRKNPAISEIRNRDIARKSLVARTAIRKGDVFSTENLTAKRPGIGISPVFYYEWLGRCATRNYQADDLIAETGE